MVRMENTALRLARVRQLVASGAALSIRQRSRLGRGDIAREIGSTVTTVRRWETGERVPTGDAALRYEALLQDLDKLALRTDHLGFASAQ